MTHIEQMIQDLCPNGVEWKTLGEVTSSIKTGLNPRTNFVLNADGAIHYYVTVKEITTGKILFSDKTDRITEEARIRIQERSLLEKDDILFSGIGTIGKVAIVDIPTDNWNCSESVYLIKPKKSVIFPKYLMYFLGSIHSKEQYESLSVGSTLKGVRKNVLEAIEIPIPPIEIQKKIVECLDKFSALAAELQAELQARRKQYEFYRTQLLTPPQNISFGNSTDERNWKWKTIEEIFELRGGYTPSKNNPVFWEGGTIPWFRMEDIRENGRILKDAILHITPIAVKGKGLFEKDSFVLATSATIGEHALLAVDALTNQRFTNLKVREQYKSVFYTKFIFYYMFKVDEFCKAHTNISGFESVDMDALKKMPFPIPPLKEQKRIADFLDKFEALTTSLSDGIPAEQAAQQKRYEYYRDKLLSFEKKGN